MESAIYEPEDAEAQTKPEACTGFSEPGEVPDAILQKIGRDGIETVIEKGELPPSDVRVRSFDMRNNQTDLLQPLLWSGIIERSI